MDARITIDLIECRQNLLQIDGSVDRDICADGSGPQLLLNGKALPMRYTGRYADVTLREETLTNRIAFVVQIPLEQLGRTNRIACRQITSDGISAAQNETSAMQSGTSAAQNETSAMQNGTSAGKESRGLPLLSSGYQARVCSELRESYWCFPADRKPKAAVSESEHAGKSAAVYMIRYHHAQDGTADYMTIDRVSRAARVRQEIRFLWEIFTASYGSRQMFLMRCRYWLAWPTWHAKRIWITFDKLYKGGDCGEYFYKYMMTRTEDHVVPVYVIRNNVPDYRRLQAEGFHPAAYRSTEQRLDYLFAKAVFATHSGVNSFCGFNNWEIRFLQDRLQAANTCIQHGLSVQDLRRDSHRVLNNNQRYYCASPCEISNLSQPWYDYDPEVLRLTGIPRYDGLVNQAQRQILITPTWRSYLAMPAVMGSARPYNPDFIQSDYYRIYQSLLDNRQLSETAERTGYRIIYLLHPVLSAQKEDFHPQPGIEIIAASEANYEELLTRSGLMVTDYSGVQFDFAYMRKPVVYFHPPQLPPHYGDGGFDYPSQGFGEICTDGAQLVQILCRYMESGCQMSEPYRRRADAFFAFDDRQSCRRIYEDALTL